MTLLFVFLPFLFITIASSSSITNPFNENGDIDNVIPEHFDHKKSEKSYHRSKPGVLSHVDTIREESSCGVEFRFRWSTALGSSIFSSPIIFPSGPLGQKQIFQNTFYQYIEMLSYDGYKPWYDIYSKPL